jgi:hypothetical protein
MTQLPIFSQGNASLKHQAGASRIVLGRLRDRLIVDVRRARKT